MAELICHTSKNTFFAFHSINHSPSTMISALAWVPKGAAAPNPKRYQMSVTEIAMLQQQAENMENAIESDSDNEHNPNAVVDGDFPEVDISELPADLRMDEYSDDEVGRTMKKNTME